MVINLCVCVCVCVCKVVMARHGLCDASVQQIILLCESLSPALGGAISQVCRYICVCMYVYVCMCVCMYVRMYVCMYVCMYAVQCSAVVIVGYSMYAYVCVCVCVCTYSVRSEACTRRTSPTCRDWRRASTSSWPARNSECTLLLYMLFHQSH